MYEIINKENGQRIAFCEQPRLVKIKDRIFLNYTCI